MQEFKWMMKKLRLLHISNISADGNCNKDTRSRIGMAKKRMLGLVPIWKDRGINKYLKMKRVRSLVWTVLTYGAEGWTLTKADEKRSNQQNCGFIVGCYESVVLNRQKYPHRA